MQVRAAHIRWGALGLAILLSMPLFQPPLSGVYLWASPFLWCNALLSGTSLSWVHLLGLGFLGAAVFRKRWICRYACPAGVICDLASDRGIRKKIRMKLHPGKHLAMLALVLAALGAPLLAVTDPFNLFFMGLEGFRTGFGLHAILKSAGLLFLVIFSLLLPHLWCSSVCPLGGLQLLVYDAKEYMQKLIRTRAGTGAWGMDRRYFLTGMSGIVGGLLLPPLFGRSQPANIRPPFSLPEDELNMTCIRCGSCTSACPTSILHPCTTVNQPASLLTPMVTYTDSYCLPECDACGKACPSGAIQRFNAAQKGDHVMGIAVISLEDCYIRNGKECNLCRQYCDFDAIRMVASEQDFTRVPVVIESQCVGCGACLVVCPPRVIRIRAGV